MSAGPARPIVAAAMCIIALVAAAGSQGLSARQERQRSVVVTVLDRSGSPVRDLSADALVIREDGVAREIVSITPAPPPTEIALLVDDSQAAMPLVRDLREALNGFADAVADMAPAPAVRVATIGDRPTVVVDFNPSFSAVSRGIDRISPRPGSGATLMEAIVETARDLRARKAQRPVVVAFVVEAGPEFGTLRRDHVADALREAGAALWTIVLTSARGSGGSDADRERDMVIGDVTRESGGMNRTVLTGQQLPAAFERLAATLGSGYEVTYGRPERLIPPSRIEIQARDEALTVVTSRWAAP